MNKIVRTGLIASLFLTVLLVLPACSSNVGKTIPSLSELQLLSDAQLEAGKPTIVEFWATWCPPCRDSIPHLNKIYKKHREQGLQIVGITAEKEGAVTSFTKKVPIHYTVALDESTGWGKKFRVRGIPHAMLVNRDGKIVWEGHPMQMEDSQIEALVK